VGVVGGAPAGDDSAGAAGSAGGSGGDGLAGSGAGGDGLAGSGAGGDGLAGSDAGGDGLAGSGGAAGSAGSGQAGSNDQPDASGAAGTAPPPPDAGPVSPMGCADGTREGFKSLDRYPNIAACAGAWQVAGLVAPETLAPQCDRHAGNDGTAIAGGGCSVADLCAEGWHVCESAREVSTNALSCADAAMLGAPPAFYVTRQRGPMMTCDRLNLTGTNDLFGCGNFGSAAPAACAPFARMLRDADCRDNPPWMCTNGPLGYSVSELTDVTKSGPSRGGVLCCR
jgi:hypothetical protein